jgi:hypothetical protein
MQGGVLADGNSRIDEGGVAIVQDEIGDSNAAGHFEASMPHEQEEVLRVCLPATGFVCCNFANAESVRSADVTELALPGVALFCKEGIGRPSAMPLQYGSNECRRIAENPI